MNNDFNNGLPPEQSEQFVKPLDLTNFSKKCFVAELTAMEQINCEGNYWVQFAKSIKSRNWRLFHLECYGVSSTILMTNYGDCLEHRGRFNKPLKKKYIMLAIDKKHIELAEQLSSFVHRKYCNIDEYMQSLVDFVSSIAGEGIDEEIICDFDAGTI